MTDLEELEARAGAVAAILAARDEGLCRWVGITGHELTAPAAHLEALRRYDLDTVMFPVNPQLWSDSDYRRDAEALLDHAAEHDVGVMAIKAAAARPWAGRPARPRAPGTSPTPIDREVSRGVGFALSTPGVHAFCTPGDTGVLRTALAAAEAYAAMDDAEREAAVASVGRRAQHLPDARRLTDGGPTVDGEPGTRTRGSAVSAPAAGDRGAVRRWRSGNRWPRAPRWWSSSR